MVKLTKQLTQIAEDENIQLADNVVDDVLIYAQFQQVGLNFLKNRANSDYFEPVPTAQDALPATEQPAGNGQAETYQVMVDGRTFDVVVAPGDGVITQVQPIVSDAKKQTTSDHCIESVLAPLAGSVIEILVSPGDRVEANQELMCIEAMKMEVQICSTCAGEVTNIFIGKGDSVVVDQELITIGQ